MERRFGRRRHVPGSAADLRHEREPRGARARPGPGLAERRRAFPDTYAPFTIDEYRAMPLDYSFLDECAGWPARRRPPGREAGSECTVSGRAGAGHFGRPGQHHHLGGRRGGRRRVQAWRAGAHRQRLPCECAGPRPQRLRATMARRFIATLDAGDSSCAARTPPVRLVAKFARRAADCRGVEPAGQRRRRCRLASRGGRAQTVGDAVVRAASIRPAGGRIARRRVSRARTAAGLLITLDGVRWVEDVAVSAPSLAHRAPTPSFRPTSGSRGGG